MTPLSLFSYRAPAVRSSATSVAAARSITPAAGTLRAQVLEYIRKHPGSTDEQIQEGTGLNPSTQRPRRVELERAGLIERDGEGTTKSGRRAAKWRVKP